MNSVENIKKELLKFSSAAKKEKYYQYFQAFPGGYGEGDEFYGVTVPEQRKLAKKFYNEISLEEAFQLLENPVHECRLTSVFILVLKFQKTKDENIKQKILHNNYRKLLRRDAAHLGSFQVKDDGFVLELNSSFIINIYN